MQPRNAHCASVDRLFIITLTVLVALVSSSAALGQATASVPSNEDCQTCHSEGSTAAAVFTKSTHASLACVDCHADLATTTEFPHPEKLKPAACVTCHEGTVAKFQDSIHEEGRRRLGLAVAPTCSGCHGTHDILAKTDSASRVHPLRVAGTCGACHVGIVSEYDQSIHAKRLRTAGAAAPTCSTCHTAHSIRRTNTASFQLDVIQECGTCHVEKIRTYRDTFHGQVTALGFERVAKCADCHDAHRIMPARDPASTVSPGRLVETCARCHPGANDSFVRYDPHPNPNDYGRGPVLWWVKQFYTVLIAGCFSFFGLHTLLWFWRSRKEREAGR
jgi:predicted CXXCH cytochrome family protein